MSWWQILAVVWLAGMIAFLAYHAIKHYCFVKMARRWNKSITDEKILNLLQSIKGEMGISKRIDLSLCSIVGSPMMIGFTKPWILLPTVDLAEDELHFILKHELVHYKRKDLLYKYLILVATAIHWFNPVFNVMSKVIANICEISCDAEVVQNSSADMRQQYSETIIGVVKYQSKLKTALSTYFYGGKKGMKSRIASIMDTGKKKAGIAIIGFAVIVTMGTGYAFAAKPQAHIPPEYISIKEDIKITYAHKFLPNPEIYDNYSPYGISISDDGEKLLYNGQRVKLFVDEHSNDETFYYDETGIVNLSVTRNLSKDITGMDIISEEVAQTYRTAFFADDTNSDIQKEDTNGVIKTNETKYEQYAPFGITFLAEEESMYLNGQRVRLFVDKLADGSFYTFWVDEDGTVDLSVVRNSSGQIAKIEAISREAAQAYLSSADELEQKVLNGIDEKVSEIIKRLYPES